MEEGEVCGELPAELTTATAATATTTITNSTGSSFGSSWNSWLKTAGDFVSSKSIKIIESVTPDIREFAETITGDASKWVKEKTSDASIMDFNLFAQDNRGSVAQENDTNCIHSAFTSSRSEDGIAVSRTSGDSGSNSRGDSSGSAYGVKKNTMKCPSRKSVDKSSSYFRVKYDNIRVSESCYTSDPECLVSVNKTSSSHNHNNASSSSSSGGLSRSGSSVSFDDYVVDEYVVLDWLNDSTVGLFRNRLVPAVVPESLFWKRFLYRMSVLHQEERQFANIMERMHHDDEDDDSIGWDVEEKEETEKRTESSSNDSENSYDADSSSRVDSSSNRIDTEDSSDSSSSSSSSSIDECTVKAEETTSKV